jgi:ribose transport system ATP-binding protein
VIPASGESPVPVQRAQAIAERNPEDSAALELRGIGKSFGATRALHGVDLTVGRAEVHALIGSNGAGKSTLVKILSGAHRQDDGEIILEGTRFEIGTPAAGRELGIATIYQELNLAPHLSVEENLTLGIERSAFGFVRSSRRRIRRVLEVLSHPELPLDALVGDLPIGIQQLVEIGRALMSDARIIIMDEPTSSLSASDAGALFDAIGALKASGVSVIYISHFLDEVTEVADSFTVLRNGEVVGTGEMAETEIPEIIRLMVGRPVSELYPRTEHTLGETILEVRDLSGPSLPRDVSLTLHRGEILGIAGLVGAGRSETLRLMFGLDAAEAGTFSVDGGASVKLRGLRSGRALDLGIDLLSENRKDEGLAVNMSVAANTTLSSLSRFVRRSRGGLLDLGAEASAVDRWIDEMGIMCRGPEQPVSELSGGNQQKVALGRILQKGCDVILLDEPTRGIDVGSKVEIYRLIGRLAAEGRAVVFVSSDIEELMGVCDTIAVMYRGTMSEIRPVNEWSQHQILETATTGVDP